MNTQRSLSIGALLLLLMLALSTLIGYSPASAQAPSIAGTSSGSHRAALGEVPMLAHSDAYGPGIWHHAPQGKTWYGAYRTFPSPFAYCVDAGKQSPLPKYFKGSKPRSITTAETAWALYEHSGSKSADVQAALSALARLDPAIPHDHTVPPQEPGELGKKFRGSAKHFESIKDEARKLAGPYTLDVELSKVPAMPVLDPHQQGQDPAADDRKFASPMTPRVKVAVSLKSGSGHLVPDVPIDLKFSGVEQAPGSITSGTKEYVETFDATHPGKVTVAASASVAPESVLLYEPKKTKKVQRVVTADKPVRVSADASVDMRSQPRVTTEISDARPQPGDSITDSFTVSGLIGDHVVTVEHELWTTASKPEVGKKNDDAEVIASVTSKSMGNGTHRSPAITIPDDFTGWLYFTETIVGDEKTEEWKGIHGQPKETGFVPWRPTAETRAVMQGTSAHDEVTVEGMRPGDEVSVTVKAYHSDTEPKQSAEVHGDEIDSQEFTVAADQKGTVSFATEDIEVPVGWVTFVVTVHKNEVHDGWTSDWGIPAETVHREPEEPPAPPTTPPPPPEEPPAPPEEPPVPPAEPTQPVTPPENPAPPVGPVEQPEAPAAPDRLPRTGVSGNGVLIGTGIFLIGLGAAALLVTGRRNRED